MKTKNLFIYSIDTLLLVGTLLLLITLIDYSSPLVVAKLKKDSLNKTNILFSFDNSSKLFLDTSMSFKNSREIPLKDNYLINLNKQVYFFKIISSNNYSQIIKLDVKLPISLKLVKNKTNFYVVNSNKNSLILEIYDSKTKLETLELTSFKNE